MKIENVKWKINFQLSIFNFSLLIVLLKLGHELDQGFHALVRHGIINAGAHTTDSTVTLQIRQTSLGCRTDKGRVQFFTAGYNNAQEIIAAQADMEKTLVDNGMTIIEVDKALFNEAVAPAYEKLGWTELRAKIYEEAGV